MTDINAEMLMRHEREFGAVGARLGNLEAGHANTRADFKDALTDIRGDLKEGVGSMRDEMVRQIGHLRGESIERVERLETSLQKVAGDLVRQREAEEKAIRLLVEQIEESNRRTTENARNVQKINRGIVLAAGAILVGTQYLIEHVLPLFLGHATP